MTVLQMSGYSTSLTSAVERDVLRLYASPATPFDAGNDAPPLIPVDGGADRDPPKLSTIALGQPDGTSNLEIERLVGGVGVAIVGS